LLTFYGYLRGTTSEAPWRWNVLAIGACALGMASKETMVTAPLLVFLHDAMFVAGSGREAGRARGWLHAGLVATWLIFAVVVMAPASAARGNAEGVAWWAYALAQSEAVVQYLRLSLWPDPLVMDYGTDVVSSLAEMRWQIIALIGLGGATVAALRRRMPAGFLGAWFFAVLAPSSSVVPTVDTMAEPRMYLPLAAVIALGVVAGYGVTGRRSPGLWLALPMVFVAATRARVADYESELRIWGDTVLKRPFNARAHVMLGNAWRASGKLPEAIMQYEVALKLRPARPETLSALAGALLAANRIDEAIGCATEAVRVAPDLAEGRRTLGDVLARAGRGETAITQYRAALRLEPANADTHYRLAEALATLKQHAEATTECEAALRLDPAHVGAKALLERLRNQR
jgi:tetratricopeptide (TPR) repeat protein